MAMMNKGSFKSIGKESIVSETTDGIKIYLESNDDQYILKHWFSTFNFFDKLSFESVSEAQGGGCQLVLKSVENSSAAAYGIVDRDILLANPDFQDSLWWELDDEVFSSSKPFGDNIFVLHRWELENYLLHPQVLASLVAAKKLDSSRPASEIARILCDHEDDMIAVTCLSALATKNGFSVDGKNETFRDKSGEELTEEIHKKLQVDPDVIDLERTKIKNFAEDDNDPIKRWDKLSRLLDGKRIMRRIDKLLFSDKVKLESERGVLAEYIPKHSLVDRALTSWLEQIHSSTA